MAYLKQVEIFPGIFKEKIAYDLNIKAEDLELNQSFVSSHEQLKLQKNTLLHR